MKRVTKTLLILLGIFVIGNSVYAQSHILRTPLIAVLPAFKCKVVDFDAPHFTRKSCTLNADNTKRFEVLISDWGRRSPNSYYTVKFKDNMSINDIKVPLPYASDAFLRAVSFNRNVIEESPLCYNRYWSIRPPNYDPEAFRVDTFVTGNDQINISSYIEYFARKIEIRRCVIF